MSNILTSISFSTPDLDKASGPKLYWKLSSNISSKDLTRKASLSQYKCASCRPVSTSCRPVSNERSNRLWTRVHSPTSNQKYCIVLQFYGLINCKYCQIYYFSAPGACKILDLLKATSRPFHEYLTKIAAVWVHILFKTLRGGTLSCQNFFNRKEKLSWHSVINILIRKYDQCSIDNWSVEKRTIYVVLHDIAWALKLDQSHHVWRIKFFDRFQWEVSTKGK